MPAPTIRETLIAGAHMLGAEPIESKSSKYQVFRVKAGTILQGMNGKSVTLQKDKYLFFGPSGACRVADRNAATASIEAFGWRSVLMSAIDVQL